MQQNEKQWKDERACSFLLYLANLVDTLSFRGLWILTALSFAAIAVFNFALYWTGLHIAPLYMVPVALVSWRLGLRAGITVALTAAATSLTICLACGGPAKASALSNLVLQLLTLPVLAAIVASFRCSFDREHFLARRDGTTGAYNRVAFEQIAEQMILKASSKRARLLLIFFDLDGFKIINDRYGHEAGDRVLESLGAAAGSELPLGACFGRMGGDEFAILIPLEPHEDASHVTEHLHQRLSSALSQTIHGATCSMGAVIIPPGLNLPLKDIMRRADRVMYAVKRSSKNGVQFAALSHGLEQDELPLFAGTRAAADRQRLSEAGVRRHTADTVTLN
ncbi:diguanylate cyclase domain-containing protein [Brucella tritici]|uniref:diguanylate cyclase n=1 Tax=Brucella tritici TaxID=94626 RepID=A0A6L3YUL6_9HYPH|nr:diguanylate cyclase [Brucella tritici]KAB2688447.1 diguanylate cyclase [Brucella tritici]